MTDTNNTVTQENLDNNVSSQPVGNWKRPFFTFWISQAFSLFGSYLVQFALVWWLTKTTGSASVLAVASTLAILPEIIISPFAGTIVDRINRKRVIILADSVIALATIILAVFFYFDIVQIWHVYVVMFLRAVGSAFHYPAEQASISLMVPKEHLARIAGLNQALGGIINVITPSLGALLLEWLNVQSTLAIDFVTAFLAVVILAGIHIPQPEKVAENQGMNAKALVSDFKGGFRYIFGWKGMVYLIIVAMIIKIALSPAFSLLPLLVSQHFNGDAAQYGFSESIAGIGVVLGGLLLSAWGGFKKKIFTTFSGAVLLGASFICVNFLDVEQFTGFLVIMFVVGFAVPLIDGPIMAILQSKVDPDYQGRVLTTMSSLMWLTTPVGLWIAGPVSDHFGIQIWYLIAGLLTIFTILTSVLIPQLRDIEDSHVNVSVKEQIAVD